LEIKVLGSHNCESNTSKLTSLLIDDKLALDASAITSNLSFESQKNLKAVLITHHHYDHIRDIPALAMNFYLLQKSITIYTSETVVNKLKLYLLNDDIYPRFFERPPDRPTINFVTISEHKTCKIEDYTIMCVPVNHSVPALGFQITDQSGKKVFYSGDTGKGLESIWQNLSPDLLIIELTAPNKYEVAVGNGTKHLTPHLLERELIKFKQLKGYLPQVLLVHINPLEQDEIAKEIGSVASSLNASITLGVEGMRINL
jgi:ribonuclease BN (tRNA processing enzyme)